MIEKLLELHKNSYVPISNYPVSAIVVTKDGKEYPGVNVEDASTRAGTCAERAAIFTALTAGVKKGSFKEKVHSINKKNGWNLHSYNKFILSLLDNKL